MERVQCGLWALGLFFSSNALADGLSELQSALARLQGTSPISALLQTQTEDIDGRGEEQSTEFGQASVLLSDGTSGLQVTYSNDVLAQIDAESKLKVADEEAATPTLNAVNNFDATELRSMLSAANALQRRLSQASFVEEKPRFYQGQAARLLVFDMPLEAVLRDKQARKYVKTFTGQFSVTVDANGVPLQSQLDFTGKGRAFLVLRMEAAVSEVEQYQVVGQRLLRMSSKSTSSYSTTFGDGRYIRTDTLQLNPASTPISASLAPDSSPAL